MRKQINDDILAALTGLVLGACLLGACLLAALVLFLAAATR